MMFQQKTFSVALSRQMAPQSRMVVYCVKDEEILVDTLTFMVKDSRLHNVRSTILDRVIIYPNSWLKYSYRGLNISTPVQIFQLRCKYLNRGVNM